MLPDGWSAATVADVCDFQNGRGFGPDDWTDHGLPIIRIQNLNGGTSFDYYAGEPEERWLVRPGQILFAWAGTRGVSFGPCMWHGPTGVLNQHIFKVTPRDGIDAEWLFWALRHVTDRIERNAHGFKATLLHVKKSDVERQSILIPPRTEQVCIRRVLATWQRALRISEQQLTTSQARRYWLAQELLSGRAKFKRNSSWKPTAISELIAESRILGSSGDLARKLTVKLYGKGVVAKPDGRTGSESTKYYRRTKGQFIYSKLDFLNGAFGLVPEELDGYESTLDVPAFDFRAGVDPRWFLHFVSRESFYRDQLGIANGGRKARRVNPRDLAKIVINVPPLEEQREIAEAIDHADQIVRAEERQAALLKAEKTALLQMLIAGKRSLRLSASEAA